SFSTLVRAIEQGRLTFANIKKAARCALTDNAGELSLILISLAAQAVWHIPIAITAIQVLAVDVVAELFPITALGWDKPVGKLLRDYPRRLGDHIFSRSTVREFILFGLLAGTIAYANFLFFFVRAGLSPAYIDTASGLYAQATILAYITLVFCQFTNLLLVRADEQGRFFTSYLWSNRKLLIAFGISLACIGIIIYCPTVRPYFDAGPLSLADWLTALGGAAVYLGIRLLQRHTRKHSRAAVVRLHQAVHGDASSVRI
ncbi:MAG TPA: cation transporting ATPase C-terminal domain-containing protein, partial [Candidatus Saccharimonadales bacterium]|nr:cation transporting ATPase C-terminal domain-containing protein [Candidatus Saccharimonadales bacterium]